MGCARRRASRSGVSAGGRCHGRLLANGQREQRLRKLRRVGLLALVGEVWTAEDVGAAKPAAQTYLTVLWRVRHKIVRAHIGCPDGAWRHSRTPR